MALVEGEVAGDPVTGKLWVQRSVRKLQRALAKQGHRLSKSTIQRVLSAAGIHPKSNVKHLTPRPHPDRDTQFRYLLQQRQRHEQAGDPVVSVDAKNRELIGRFYQRGTVWRRHAHEVFTHDFPGDAEAKLVPYRIYDVARNEGFVFVGLSALTADFAVDALLWWWRHFGRRHYPKRIHLLILADGGGCNGYRVRRWKYRIQRDFCEGLGLTMTVCHYPPGASKWNPVEHRLLSQISESWAGLPLTSVALAMAALRRTRTKTGLRVRAKLTRCEYRKGEMVAGWQWKMLQLEAHPVCSVWNYTLKPRRTGK